MTCKDVQKAELAGKTKLTAVTIYANGVKRTRFFNLLHDAQGRAILPMSTLNAELERRGSVGRGQTISIG